MEIYTVFTKTQDNQNDLEKEVQRGGLIFPDFKTYKVTGNQDIVLLAQDGHKAPQNRIETLEINSYIWAIYFWPKHQGSTMGKRQSSISGVGTIGYPQQKEEVRTLAHTKHKN